MRNISGSVSSEDDEDLIKQYRKFLSHLESLFIKMGKNFHTSKLDSKEIIRSILKKENITLFDNVQVIPHCICVACFEDLKVVQKVLFRGFSATYKTTFVTYCRILQIIIIVNAS